METLDVLKAIEKAFIFAKINPNSVIELVALRKADSDSLNWTIGFRVDGENLGGIRVDINRTGEMSLKQIEHK